MTAFPRTIIPFEVSSLEMPGPLISKAQSGRVNIRSTQQIGRTWTEHYLINVRSVAGRGLLAAVDNFYRNGTIFTIDHRDHLTPMGTGGGSPLVNQMANLISDPENFSLWTPSGTPVLTSGQADPYGGTAAYKIEDDAAGAFEYIVHASPFVGDGEKTAGIYARFGNSTITDVRLQDVTAGVTRHRVRLTWTAGVPVMSTISGAGTRFAILTHDSGWYRALFSATGVVAANNTRLEVCPVGFDVAANVGFTYFYGAATWNNTAPADYLGTGHPAATGSNIYIDGAPSSTANWLRAGDIIGLGGVAAVYQVASDVTTDTGGYALVPVNPPIFSGGAPADNAVVTITGVTMNACILEPPSYPSTSGIGADWGEVICKFSESL